MSLIIFAFSWPRSFVFLIQGRFSPALLLLFWWSIADVQQFLFSGFPVSWRPSTIELPRKWHWRWRYTWWWLLLFGSWRGCCHRLLRFWCWIDDFLPDEEHEDHESVGEGHERADFDAEAAVESASRCTTLLRFNNKEGSVHQYQIYMIGFNYQYNLTIITF